MTLEPQIAKTLDELIDAIQESDCYKNFEEHRKNALKDPAIKQSIQRTREIRKQLSAMSDNDKMGNMAEALIDEYDSLCDITAVHEFSIAELDFCNAYREILAKLVNSFEIEL